MNNRRLNLSNLPRSLGSVIGYKPVSTANVGRLLGVGLVFVLLFSCSLKGQDKRAETHQRDTETLSKEEDGLSFLEEGDPEWTKDIKQIILVRHGAPDLKRKGWYKRKEAQQFILDYDSVGVEPFEHSPLKLKDAELPLVVSSSLPRAEHTAQLIFGRDREIITDTLYREFERQILAFPNIKMPLKFWTTSSRMLWLIGLNDRRVESKKAAYARAARASDALVKHATEQGQVVLVAHGWMNRRLIKVLNRAGWEVIEHGGSDHLAASLLVKKYTE